MASLAGAGREARSASSESKPHFIYFKDKFHTSKYDFLSVFIIFKIFELQYVSNMVQKSKFVRIRFWAGKFFDVFLGEEGEKQDSSST